MTDFWNNWWQILLIIGSLVALLGFCAWKYLTGRGEKGAHRRVSSVLRKFAALRGYRVLDAVALNVDGRDLHMDHILVGYFGLLLVADLCMDGDYYGKADDKTWSCNTKGTESTPSVRKATVANPLPNSMKYTEAVRSIFSKNGVYNVSIDSVVVAADPASTLFITGRKDSILTLRELRDLLGRSKYSQDNGLDVEKLCALLQS